ncbi:unnamed protein product [Scytosiphon promiscuus]
METEEEFRVLLAAAERGRADIISRAIEALTGSAANISAAEAYKERQRILSIPRERDGASALHISSMNGHVDATRALLRLGAPPEAGVPADVADGGSRADTPLHWAASGGHVNIASMLLERGADLNICNSEGASALHEASKCGNVGVVSLLLGRGADPHMVGIGGVFKNKTPDQVSSSEAVAQALRSTVSLPPSVPSPSSIAAPSSSTPLPKDASMLHFDGARLPRIGTGSEKEGLVGSSSNGHARGRGNVVGERHRFEQGRAWEEATVCGRKNDQEKPPLPRAAGPGGVGKDESERALPMLWPPPKSCVVIRDKVCRMPLQVMVVLPAGGEAGPGTVTLQTLLAAFTSHGVGATCTRGRSPPGGRNEFYVTLACGGLQGACASSAARGGQGFSLTIGSSMVRVAGTGEPGLYYGVKALCQLLRFYSSSKEATLDIPCCILRDEPDVVRRSLVLDVRYPLLPTLQSLTRTIEAASDSRVNVVQLTVTRDTAAWLEGRDQRCRNEAAPASRRREGGASGSAERGDSVDSSNAEGVWGWGSLGALEAFCKDRFVELVLGWTVVPGDESKEAQRAAVQLLSSLSRQFQSHEMHIVFDEGVKLSWESDDSSQPVDSPGGVHHRRDFVRGPSSSGPSDMSPSGAAATATNEQEKGLSLTRFLSNVVVSCPQGTLVLDGVPVAAITYLQGIGYLPVELAFSLGAAKSSGLSSATLSGDGVAQERSDEISMLLGPVHLGYVCGGHQGAGSGVCEEACLSIRGALSDVAAAVAVAHRTGCGVQLRVSTTMAPHSTAPRPGPSGASTSAAASDIKISGEGAHLYYPALLSNALAFFGAGLCWRLDKASAALNLSAAEADLEERGFEGNVAESTSGKQSSISEKIVGTPVPVMLFMAHVLQINEVEAGAILVHQLSSCIWMLLEYWDPSSAAQGERKNRAELDPVMWEIIAPSGNASLQFFVHDYARDVLKSLQRRFHHLEAASKLVCDALDESNASAKDLRAFFMDIHRTARLLKISGRLLQAISYHVGQGRSAEHSNDARPFSLSPAVPSPSPGPRLCSLAGRRERAASNMFEVDNGEGDARCLRESLAQLPSSTRLDFANRFLEEFRAASAAWDSTRHLSVGKAVLHASLSRLLKNLAHDESSLQMEALCKRAIYNKG